MIKNDLILKALKGESVNRPPVWVMRQAGRYLPEFRTLKEKYDFFTRCETPELATEITLQPIARFQPDAAIIFSDILVIPKAMGQQVEMKTNIGPWLPKPISNETDINQLSIPNIEERLGYVLEAIKLTKRELNNEIPLIGFAGTPWTLLCYMVEGQGSKTFDKPKAFCFQNPKLAKIILDKITKTTIAYLQAKIKAGCNIIQLFDSWGGILSPKDYQEIALPYNLKIIKAIAPLAPMIFFGKGCWFAMEHYKNIGLSGLAIDWTCPISYAKKITQNKITLQGNLDPSILLSSKANIQKETKNMIDAFGKQRYIANLGHGILPNVPVDHAKTFIDTVKNYS